MQVIAVIVVVLSVLSLGLRGTIAHKTYAHMKIPASSVETRVATYDFEAQAGFRLGDFSSDLENWVEFEKNIHGSTQVENGILCLSGKFDDSTTPQYVEIYRRLEVRTFDFPIFRVNVSVSSGAIYHIRFVGRDSFGAKHNVWWESSPLDDLRGESRWETRVVDLKEFSKEATGEPVPLLTRIQFVLDKPYSLENTPEKSLCIASISFSAETPNLERVDGQDAHVAAGCEVFAAIISLPREHLPTGSWRVNWVSITYTLASESEFQYQMLLLSSRDSAFFVNAEGPVLISHRESFSDVYRLDAIAEREIQFSEEMLVLKPVMSDFSVLISKKGIAPTGSLTFRLKSIELMLWTDHNASRIIPSNAELAAATTGVGIAVIIVPTILLSTLSLGLRQPLSRHRWILERAALCYGILVRFALAPFTGHQYDVQVWTQSMRLFYESGVVEVALFPLPFTYYSLLLSYSPYALLRVLRFQDVAFSSHVPGMLESVFIKTPFILSDLVVLYALSRIFERLRSAGVNRSEGFTFGLMYFLNPLAIYLSSVWGMCDSIAIALFFAGIYFWMRERPLLSALSYVMSGLTKGFGFIGLIPLSIESFRKRNPYVIFAVVALTLLISSLLYLPLFIARPVEEIPETLLQFFRGRAGFGSNLPHVAGASYMSYVTFLGLNIDPSLLTYALVALTVGITFAYARSARGTCDIIRVELVLRFFAAWLLVYYLIFFRIYEQYYLWVIPVLIAYSYVRRVSSPRFVALAIGLALTLPQGALLAVGQFYYGIPLSVPEDMVMMTLVASSLAVCGLVSILDLKGRLKIFETATGIATLAVLASWFSFTIAYFGYHKHAFLGDLWYLISFALLATAAILLHRQMLRASVVAVRHSVGLE